MLFEKGDYEACIAACDEAVETGRTLRADYKLVAKAMTRKGNALVRLEKLEEATQVYHKSLMEHRFVTESLNDSFLARVQAAGCQSTGLACFQPAAAQDIPAAYP